MQTCPHCQFSQISEGSRFCPNCGGKIAETVVPPAESPATTMQVKQDVGKIEEGAKAIGAEIGQIEGSLTVVNGTVIQVHDPSPEFLKHLEEFNGISVEMQPGKSQAAASAAVGRRLDTVESSIQAVMDQVRQAETQGHKVEHLQAGDVQVSRVELLVKQAILLQAEGEQMMLEQMGKQQESPEQSNAQGGGQFEIDVAEPLKGFDWQAYTDKLKQAYELLVEANALEPTNANVLLLQAKLAAELEHDDEAGRLLYKVMKLVENPKNEQEKFWLAQALYLSSVQKDAINEGMLRQARQLFEQLGRTSWV